MWNPISSTFFQYIGRIVFSSLFGICIVSSVVTSTALAQGTSTLTLESGRWNQLTIPADASELSIRQLFSEALPESGFGSRWFLYLFDAQSGSYRDPGLDGLLRQGDGFWLIQITSSPITIELPENISPAYIQSSTACSAAIGCTEVPLIAREGQSTFNLIGSGLSTEVSISDVRIRTQAESSACRGGCSWQEAVDLQYVSGNLWHYDSGDNQYIDLAYTGRIAAWQGFWLRTLPGLQASGIEILFPGNSEQADCTSSSGFAGDDGLKLWCWSDLATEINALTDQSFIDDGKLFTSVHHYPDDTSSYLPVEVVDDQLVFTVTPRGPLSTTKTASTGESSAWNYRSEVRDSPSNVDHPNGTEQWWGFNYTFGDDYIIDDLPWIMWQTHANESTPTAPVQAIEVASTNYGRAGNVRGEIVIANNVYYDSTNSTGSIRSRTQVIPQAGQTLKVVIQMVWGTESTGLLRIWFDDVPVYSARERTSFPEHEEGGYWKAGIYKWRWQKESNIEISEALGISRLQTSMGSLRVIKNDPDDAAYLTDQYSLVDPAQDQIR